MSFELLRRPEQGGSRVQRTASATAVEVLFDVNIRGSSKCNESGAVSHLNQIG